MVLVFRAAGVMIRRGLHNGYIPGFFVVGCKPSRRICHFPPAFNSSYLSRLNAVVVREHRTAWRTYGHW